MANELENLSAENLESNTRLELKYRAPLQALVMQKVLGGNNLDANFLGAQWGEEHSKQLSEVIDAPDNEPIRQLARAGRYEEAANIVAEKILGLGEVKEAA